MNTITKSDIELSERLRKACLEKGITEPRFVAQDGDGTWCHYQSQPYTIPALGFWEAFGDYGMILIEEDTMIKNWRDTLMEFVKPTVENGKMYWQRDGNITFNMRMVHDGDCFTDGVRSWLQDGSFYGDQLHRFDLIAEYTGEPLADILKNTCDHCGKYI